MYGSFQRSNDGLPVALAMHLGIYCAVAVCFAFGVYEFMQPSRIPNPGLAGYKPPPGSVDRHDSPSSAVCTM